MAAWRPPEFDERQLMMLTLAQQGMNDLGQSFIRGANLRQGKPMGPQSQQNSAATMMQFAQQQRALKQREAAQAAIGGLKTVPEDVRTLMSLYPEESIKPYIQGQLRPERQKQDIWSSPAGLYKESLGGIIPGTGPPPKESGAPTVKEFTEGDKTVMKQWNGQTWETLSSAPRWQPDKPGGGGGAGAALAPYLGIMPMTSVDPNTGETVVSNQFFGATRQKGQLPSPVPIGQPIEAKREMPVKQRNDIAEIDKQLTGMEGILKDVQADPTAFDTKKSAAVAVAGSAGNMPRSFTERQLFTPAQIETRNALFNQVSQTIKDRAGTAATKGEMARIERFLPGETDAPEQITAKIKGFQRWLGEQRSMIAPGTRPAPAAAPPAPTGLKSVLRKQDFDALPSGAEFIAPDGTRRRKP